MQKEIKWDLILTPKNKWYDLHLRETWKYRDLLFLFVKRDFVAIYKQTILGPLWLLIQPVLTTLTFIIIFGNIAKIGTNGMPSILFYFSGILLWTYFSDCLTKTAGTFISNAGIFGKVYFPRLIIPLSILISNLIKLGIQFLLFMATWFYFFFSTDAVHPNNYLFLLPVLILIMAGLGFGFGLIISAMTAKYRDLTFLIGFGTQLVMYATPIVYPLSIVPENYRKFLLLNPLTSVIETFKYSFTGVGEFNGSALLYSFCFMVTLVIVAMIIFNRIEKSFMDTV